VRLIVWHCSATRPDQNIGRAEIDAMHRAKKPPWDGIGYHVVICRNGRIELGEELQRVGAHVLGRNYDSVAVVMIGGINVQGVAVANFTAAQWESAFVVQAFLRRIFPLAETLGHRDLSPDLDGDGIVEPQEFLKRCPCFDARATFATGAPVYDSTDKVEAP
jgi:hypothetical protein